MNRGSCIAAVRVSAVAPESAADVAGVKIGDILISVDGRDLRRIPSESAKLILSQTGNMVRAVILLLCSSSL
jgi:C-terminal processing protease CtpA/Prc